MIRLELALDLSYDIFDQGCDFIFNIHAAHTQRQLVLDEALVLSYLYPSRYCQSDRLHRLAMREFGQLWQGYSRVQTIRDWV
ncbi:MAG: hypothetical protein ABIR94_11400, partial [Rubrivivax sp.]